MRRTVLLAILLCLYALPSGAVNYFVSSSGNDGSDGLSPGAAWKSPDNGDITAVLAPGDSVLIMPGVYIPDRSYVFTTSGTADDPIVYMGIGAGMVAIRTLSGFSATVRIQADNIEVRRLDLSCDILATLSGIEVDGNSCLVTECGVHEVYHDGIRVNGNNNTILKNVLWSCGDDGIKSTELAGGNRFYGNTLYDNDLSGVEILGAGNQNRVFNNIIVQNAQYGISGAADNVCGFNDVWDNPSGDYNGGVADSSEGISADPMFLDAPGADFNLLDGSLAINAGLDLGYAYHDVAPDMGAREFFGASPLGTAVWRSGSLSVPKYNEWDGSSFGTAGNTADVGTWRIIAGAEAPTRDEVILAGVDGDGDITGLIWNGISWAALSFNPLANVSESFWWGFDVAYENRSGRALVVWNNGDGGAAGLSYRIWDGSDWSAEIPVTTSVLGEPKQVWLAAKPNSNEIVLVASNENSEDYALVWDGSGWGNGQMLDAAGGDDRTDICVAYEQQTGEALVTYGKASTAVYYRIWDGSDWSGEDSLEKPADASGNVRWTTLGPDPQSDRIAMGVLTSNQDIWLSIWDEDAWEGSETATNSATGTTHPGVAVAFGGQSGEALAAYEEATSVRYRTWAGGSGWSPEQTQQTSGTPSNSIMLDGNGDTDHIMLSVQDDDNDLDYTLWHGDMWGVPSTQEIDTGEGKNQPFIFLWEVESTGADLAVGKGVSNGSPGETDTVLFAVTLTNQGPEDATGVELVDQLPAGLTYSSDLPSQGTYMSGSGLWSVGNLSNGGSAALQITATVDIGTDGLTITNTAAITALNQVDPYSTNDTARVNIIIKEAQFRMATGVYTGDGAASQAISDVGFAPDVVLVKGDIAQPTVAKTSTMSGDLSKELGTNHAAMPDLIESLDANGFTVGSSPQVNSADTDYYWVAFQAAPDHMAVGSYVGDGQDDRSISDPQFTPIYMIVMNEDSEHAMQRFSSEEVDKSKEFGNTGEKTDRIQDFGAMGFEVGKHNSVNENGSMYHYVAWRVVPGLVADSSYTGDGTDNRDIAGVGFEPEYLIVASKESEDPVQRYKDMSGDNTFIFDADAAFADGVQAISVDGFQVGTHKRVNEDSKTIYFVAFRDNSAPELAAIGPKSVDEGQSLIFTVSASDPDGSTPVLTAEDVPTNGSFLDNGDGTGTFDFDPDFGQSDIHNVRFIASDGALADSEVVAITVSDVNQPPELAAIGPKSVDEGQSLIFTVLASDPDGTTPALTAEDVPANGSFPDNGDGTGTFDFDPDYTQAGIYNVRFIASDGALADSEVVAITVDAAPLAYIIISPDSAVVSADSTVQFTVAGYDAGGQEEGPGSITWALIDSLGSVGPTGLFDPTAVGITRVTGVSGLGPADTTACLEVIPGTVATLSISPDEATVFADSTIQFTASGYDADGNTVGSLGYLTWQVLGDIGTIDALGLFTARRAGTGFVKSTSDLGVWAKTDTIRVVAGEISFIDVAPSSQFVIEDSSYQFDAYAFDADSNLVASVTTDAEWSTTDPSGSVTGDGYYKAGRDPSPPTYYVKAELHVPLGSLHTLTDSGAVTVISSGSLDYVRVELQDGTEFGDTTLSADNDTTGLYCRGYDSGNTLIGEFAAGWTVIGDDPVGSVDGEPAVLTRLRLTRTGSIRVVAEYAAGKSDTTGTITCVAGQAAILVIAPDTATAAAGETIRFAVQPFDADLNPTAPVSIDGWGVIGGIGNVSGTGLFTAGSAGTGLLTCWGAGLHDTTGTINVVPGILSSLEVQPDSVEVGLGGDVTFTASGSDDYGNATDAGDLAWDVIGEIGAIDDSGSFTALTAGTGRVSATSNVGGVTDTNRVVTVNPSSLDLLVIDPDTASVKISGQVEFSAYGFDASFDAVEVGKLTWEVLGEIGAIDPSGLFTATTPGVGKIAATSVNGTSDTTDMIVVAVPTIHEISIGHRYVHAGDENVPILSFRISNAFDGRETVERITVRNASRGAGSPQQIGSNIDTLTLYMDADESLSLSASDVLLSRAPLTADTVILSFPPVTIGPGADRTFFVSVGISRFPRDGDSLDLYLLPATDIEMAGGTEVAGADTINSLGYDIVDGLVAAQAGLVPTGAVTITPQDGMSGVLAIDVPRNGYSDDILKIVSVFNAGSADTADIDSIFLYRDGGDGVWTVPDAEVRLGRLSFTGDQWQLSGLSEELAAQVTRFYIGAGISRYASTGRTLSFGIPLHGLEMASDNDGPIDGPVVPIETITIATPEMVSVSAVDIAAREVIPGTSTGPVLGIEFSNGYAAPVLLDTLRVESGFQDPRGAAQEMLDGQVETLSLWVNMDGDYAGHSPSDILVASAQLTDGAALFLTPGLALPSGGGVLGLFIECDLDLAQSKNGNTVSFTIPTREDLRFESPVTVSGDFPLANYERFVINAFPAAGMTVFPVPGTTLFGRQTDRLFLDFVLPRNGYADDELSALRVVNVGTTAGKGALAAVRLWADAGEEGLSGDDVLLGEFDYRHGGLWEIDGLSVPVSEGGRRFLVTADVAAYGFEGGPARFEVPLQGAEFASGMDGPDDHPVGNAESHFLFPANRITVIPIPRELATVAPGASQAQVLTFALYNGYPDETHVFRDLRLTNDTRTLSSAEFADFELGQVSLYYDQNCSRAIDDDSLLAAGYFDSGNLTLSGLDISLPAESLAYFFVTANLPVNVVDSDTLAVTIEEPSDFNFMETVNINGDFPVSRGGALVIDGSVRIQYELLSVESHTLSPGDESVPVLAFRPAMNGDRTDVLDSLIVTNLGDAGVTDISSLRLYLDSNGDNAWQPGDIPLGTATYLDGDWQFANLALEVGAEDKALLVVADLSEIAASDRTIRAAVPVGGCRYASSNDGPLDEPVVSGQTLAISSSVLKVTYDKLNPKYSVGQGIGLMVRVTNLLSVPVSAVLCDIEPAAGHDLIDLDDAFVGPVNLGPNQTVDFHADYTAAHAGETYWRIRAFSSDPQESSGVVFTEPVVIQSAPANVSVEMVSSIPTAVTRGQTRVFPLSIRYRHSEGSPLAASVRLDSLRIHVEDESGAPQLADEVFSRLVLATGYTNLAIVDAPSHESSVSLVFTEPALLSPGLEQVLSLRVDIDSSATALSFALALDSGADLRFTDCNTAVPVPINPAVSFPLRTASCRISNPSRSLAVSCLPSLAEVVNRGQENVDVIRLILRHPGKANESQIQFTGLSLRFVDGERNGITASDVFESIRLVRQQAVVGELVSGEMGQGVLTARFTAPPVVSPGETDTVKVRVSVRPDAMEPIFGMEIRDSTWFVLRDLSSGALVRAVSDDAVPVIGGVFPMWSGAARLMMPAGEPEVCPESRLPASIIAGSDSIGMIEIAVHHPGGDDQSSLWLDKVRVAVTDSIGVPLDPRLLFDRIGVEIDDRPAEYQEFTTVEGGYAVFDVGNAGLVVEPGGTSHIRLVADIEAETPFDNFMLRMYRENGLAAADNTDRQRALGARVDPSCTAGLPFSTDLAGIFLPAGSPVVRRYAMEPQMGYPGQTGLEFFRGELAYKSAGPQADLVLGGIEGQALSRTDRGLATFPSAEVFEAVRLLIDDIPVAVDTVLAGNTVSLALGSEYILSRGAVRTVTLTCDVRSDARKGNYLISFNDSTFMSLLDHDLKISVDPVLVGGDYPLQTADISITAGSLSGSFVNWPNPFNPDKEITTLGFNLPDEARVDIEIFSITGELVRRLAVEASRPAGPNQGDKWNGKNDGGTVVLPGTYFCRIKAEYASGRSEEATRRVAVIR